MQSLTYAAGSRVVEVRSDVGKIHDLLRLALRPVEAAGPPVAVCSVCPEGLVQSWPAVTGECQRFPLAHATYDFYPQSRAYRISVGDAAKGHLDFDRDSVDWVLNKPMAPRAVLSLFFLDPLSLLLPRCGILLCHAAVMALPEGGVLVVGNSGAGKTTLCFLASAAEPEVFRPFCDDTALLDLSSGKPVCHPVNTGFGLTRFWLEELGLAPAAEDILQFSRDKYYLTRVPHQETSALPLVGAVLLERDTSISDGTEVKRLRPSEGLRALLACQTHIAGAYTTERLRLFQGLAGMVPVLRFRYREFCDADLFRETVKGMVCCV